MRRGNPWLKSLILGGYNSEVDLQSSTACQKAHLGKMGHSKPILKVGNHVLGGAMRGGGFNAVESHSLGGSKAQDIKSALYRSISISSKCGSVISGINGKTSIIMSIGVVVSC